MSEQTTSFSQGGFQDTGFSQGGFQDNGFSQGGFQPTEYTVKAAPFEVLISGLQEQNYGRASEFLKELQLDPTVVKPPIAAKFANEGFKPPANFENEGFQPTTDTNRGFQPNEHEFKPIPSGAFPSSSLTNKGTIDVDYITAFSKGAADAVPVGYDLGYSQGVAKAAGQPKPAFSQMGFIDTTESAAYGQGYAYGWSEGFSVGYAHGIVKDSGFSQGGFK